MLLMKKKLVCEKKVVYLPRQMIRNINPLKYKSMSVSTSCHNSDISELWSKVQDQVGVIIDNRRYSIDEDIMDLFDLLEQLYYMSKDYQNIVLP